MTRGIHPALCSLLGAFGLMATLGVAVAPSGAQAASVSFPTGVTLSGLQNGMSTTQLEAEIQAAASAPWNVQDVRLQVEQDKLTWKSGNCPIATDPVCGPYLAQIKTVVNYALGLGLKVVINDQTEQAPGYTANEPLPTHATTVFWQTIAPVWADNQSVIYDLFNEPRIGGDSASGWDVWRNGGTSTDGNSYTGMQWELTTVRTTENASNPVWVEGLGAAATLDGILSGTGTPGIAQDQLADPLHALTYTFHHPADTGTGQNSTSWWHDFGYLSNHTGNYRVVDGEFNNSVDGNQFCWTGFPGIWNNTSYKQYLLDKGVGMTVWTFGPLGTVSGLNNQPLHAVSNSNGTIDESTMTTGSLSWSMSAPTSLSLNDPAAYATPTTEQGSPSQSWTCGAANDAGMGQDFANFANGSL